jgi:HEAT repeat protein
MGSPTDWPEAETEISRLRLLHGKSLTDADVRRDHTEIGRRLYELARAHPQRALGLLQAEYLNRGVTEADAGILGALAGGLVAAEWRDAAPLIGRMLVDPVTRAVHEDLAEDLGRLGNPAGGPGLEQALKDPDVWVRAKAARSLALLGYRPAIAALVSLLGDPSGEVRVSAARALGELRAVEAIPMLRRIEREDEDEDVREAALKSLERLDRSDR